MADIAKKTVSIYIDQTSAELALEKLQQKADGFNKKAEEARKRQQQLNAEIEKSKAAAAGLDALRSQYTELEKGISKTARSLDVTTANQKKLSAENKSLSATLEGATAKQNELAAAIEKAKNAGDATKRLENNYETLSNAIQETTEKLKLNEAASAAAASRQQALTTQLQQQKAAAAALNKEVKEAASAANAVTRLTAEEAKLQKQLNASKEALDKNASAQKIIQDQIDAGLRPSFNQLTALVQKLDKELKNLSEDAPGYASKFAAFKEATAELEAMQTRITGVKKESDSLLSQFKGVAFGVAAGNLVESGIETLLSAIPNRIQSTAKLSDELADVEKATNLTADQVERLNSSLGKIDTRTPTAQLRQIAIGLGQVGEAATKANIAALDKAVVALGDEFGGDANQITKALSVLRNNLQDIKTGDYATDVEHIGNALNVLGAEGLASAPVVTDIANRIAGISQQFKVSSGDILGFAATFQELGIETERGSTAVVKLFQQIGAEPEKFAKVAGLSIKEFTDLVNNDMSAAFIAVAKGAQKAGADNVTFSKILKDLDADGSGAGEVLSKLATNSDLLAAKQKRAGQALKETSSITEEFTKKNTTLGAQLDKLGKAINSAFSSSILSDFLKSAISGISDLFTKTQSLTDQVKEERIEFGSLVLQLGNVNNTTEQRSRIISELNLKYPDLLHNLNLEALSQSQLNDLYAQGNKQFAERIRLAGLKDASTNTTKEAQELSNEIGRRRVLASQALTELGVDAKTATKLLSDSKELIKFYENYDRSQLNFNTKEKDKGIVDLEEVVRGKYYQFGFGIKGKNFDELIALQDKATQKAADAEQLSQKEEADSKARDAAQLKQLQTEIDLLEKKLKKVKELRGEDSAEYLEINKQINDKYIQSVQFGGVIPTDKPDAPPTGNTGQFLTEEQLKKQAALQKKKQVADDKQARQEEKEEADRQKRLQDRLQLESDYLGKIRILYEERLRQFPDLAGKLDEFLDTEYDSQLQKIKSFYDEKKRLFIGDAEAQKQIAAAEKAELRAFNNNQVVKSVGGTTQSTLDRLQDESIRDQRAKFELELERRHGRDLLDLQVGQLEAQRDAALKNAQLTANERLLIEKQTEEQISELKVQFETQRLQLVLDFAQQAASILSGFGEISTNRENAELARDKKSSDEKRKNYQRLLDSKAISQQQYNAKIAELDAADETRQEALRKKQFERDKRMQLLQVAISTAQAIISTLAAKPGALDILSLGAFRAVQIGFAVATGAAQAAAISSKKYARGGVLDGPSHSNGGMPVINPVTGHKEAEVEGGEVILSKRTVANNWDIINPLLQSSMYASGQRVQFPWATRSYQGINYSSVNNALKTVRKFENGGVIQPAAENSNAAAGTADVLHQNQLMVASMMQQMMDAFTKKLEQPFKGYVSLTDINDNQAQMDRIENAATASVRRG